MNRSETNGKNHGSEVTKSWGNPFCKNAFFWLRYDISISSIFYRNNFTTHTWQNRK